MVVNESEAEKKHRFCYT